ncbi:hypothetical protein [Nostoc sp.]|uniref:hypothetical protein n=1 Tax=Nostoc sp. TaxID=1180 RepID=UPI002FFAA9B2
MNRIGISYGEWGMGNGEWGMGNGEWAVSKTVPLAQAGRLARFEFLGKRVKK